MRRADRLFQILQALRRADGPRTADALAAELGTSKRTVYRDIGALVARRVPIRGEAGVGYALDRGFDLPPLMLTVDEVEAVVLGAQWVVAHADAPLARAALDVLTKVGAIVPEPLRSLVQDPAVGTPPRRDEGASPVVEVDLARLRTWCREGRKLMFRYVDGHGEASERTVWPFLVGYGAETRIVAAWCELREDIRVFRTDRMRDVRFVEARYPERPAALRRRWWARVRPQR